MRARPSGVDKDIPVFEFAMGKIELELLLGVLNTSYINTPNLFELKPHKARLRNMMNEIKNVLDKYK